MTQISDGLRLGVAYYNRAVVKNAISGSVEDLGAPASHIYCQELGAVATADADGVAVAQTATGARTLSATGILASGGIATFDVARNVTITSTSNTNQRFFLNGTDDWGETLSARVAGPNNSTTASVKAFKTVTSITVTGAFTGSVNIGTGNLMGFRYRVGGKGKVVAYSIDGNPVVSTIVTAFSATGTSTATTADVRGTITATLAPNGTRQYTITMLPVTTTKALMVGTAQA